MVNRIETSADCDIRVCLASKQSFALIAGAGSGKTESLIDALAFIRKEHGASLRRNGQRIACITYTNRAVDVIKSRLGADGLYVVSTVHSFLWSEIGRFQSDIREALRVSRIPALISSAKEKDNGGNSRSAQRARVRAADLEVQLGEIESVPAFKYENATYGNYRSGELGHDDIVAIGSHLMAGNPTFRRILGVRFPFIFVDEAQDTFNTIVEGLNLVCQGGGLPLVGYFGDPWQQIFEDRAGMFGPPQGGLRITKTENFRCSRAVIDLLNAFRTDVQQYPAGDNCDREGSVLFRLVRAEEPAAPRRRYTEEQIERALGQMDRALVEWDWQDRSDVIRLFLVRQMIARRLGFANLHKLFTGMFASTRAAEEYESGEHYLLKPFIMLLWPLISASQEEDTRRVIDLLRLNSPSFSADGPSRDCSLREMIGKATTVVAGLRKRWVVGTIREILIYCRDNGLFRFSDRLMESIDRVPRAETYDENAHGADKGDWLADVFFSMGTSEVGAYCKFATANTPFSTQHGVKGEQYPNVLVVIDDVEAEWSNYSFTKLLAPLTSGEPTDGQRERSRKLAYVCFSRAEVDLRVLLFTPSPAATRAELIESGLLKADQIELAAGEVGT